MNNIKSSFLVLTTLLVLLLSCNKQHKAPLRIGTVEWIGYEPLYWAQHVGDITPEDAEIISMSSDQDILNAFKNGSIDCAAITLDLAFRLLNENYESKILFITDISHGGDAILAQPGIEDMFSLKGKKIAVETTGSGAYVFNRAFEVCKLNVNDVEVMPGDMEKNEKAFYNKEVDVIVTYDPYKSRLMAKGAKVIFDSRQLPNEVLDIFVVNKDVVKTRKKDLEKLSNSWFKAIAQVKSQNEAAIRFISEHLGLTYNQYISSMKGIRIPDRFENQRLLSGEILESANKVADFMSKESRSTKKIDPSTLLIK